MNKIKRILIALFPLQNRIIFESNPEMACNTMPVFEEMIRREINKSSGCFSFSMIFSFRRTGGKIKTTL